MVMWHLQRWEFIAEAPIIACCKLKKKSPFGFFFREPLAEAPLHGLPARPAAIVDGGDDLEGPQPLDEALYLQIAAVFTVGDSCQETKEGFLWSVCQKRNYNSFIIILLLKVIRGVGCDYVSFLCIKETGPVGKEARGASDLNLWDLLKHDQHFKLARSLWYSPSKSP